MPTFTGWNFNVVISSGGSPKTGNQQLQNQTITATDNTLTVGETFTVAGLSGVTLTYQDTATVGTAAKTIAGFFASGSDGKTYFFAQAPANIINNLPFADTNGGGTTVCFMPGTRIATPAGEVPVEALRPGDLVLTAGGRAEPVRWIGRQAVALPFADPLGTLPVRIRAGALVENVPARDLLVSPAHALLVGGVLVQAGAMVNGTSVVREPARDLPGTFTYHHVELAEHALILAEGAPAESFVDNADREAFDNWAEHEAQAGAEKAPIREMELPRAKAARQVPAAVRALLAERAEAILGRADAAA